MLDLRKRFQLEKQIVLRGLSDKFWALDTASGNQYKLNEVAYYILNLLRTPMTAERLIEEILKTYDVSREKVVIDCSAVLRFAEEKKIIKEVSA